jgi:hypothetical protein
MKELRPLARGCGRGRIGPARAPKPARWAAISVCRDRHSSDRSIGSSRGVRDVRRAASSCAALEVPRAILKLMEKAIGSQ